MVNYKMNGNMAVVDREEIPVYGEYDVVVVGGGMAGCGAALAAGRAGCKTILIENTSGLGGLATMGLVNIPLDFLSGIGNDLFKRLTELNGLRKRNSNPETHKLVLDRMMQEANVELLLVTPLVDTIVEDNTVKGIVIHTKEGRKAIFGKRFVDASGDSDLVYFAGGEVEVGREEDHMSMGCSLEFVLGGVDMDKYRSSEQFLTDPKWVKLLKPLLDEGTIPRIDNHLNWLTVIPDRPEHCGQDEVSICFAHSRNCFPTKNQDLTRMYLEGREQCRFLAQFIKERIRFTGMDIAYTNRFDDGIAISHHGFDMHGFEDVGNPKWFKGTLPDGREAYISNVAGWGSQLPPEDGLPRVSMKELAEIDKQFYYEIPYRSLLPIRLENVLAAGRNISSDVPGQSGTRLIMCCMATGEAAGTACAMSLKEGVTPRELDTAKLQRQLVAQGCNLGQAFRRIPALEDKDYSAFDIRFKEGNG